MDTTCCPLAIPVENLEVYWRTKCKPHLLKYGVVVNLFSGMIVWVHGGFAGSIHDITIATHRLLNCLLNGERLFADKGYRGECDLSNPCAG